MPLLEFDVSSPVFSSFRVEQVAGMFDVPLADRLSQRLAMEVPDLGRDWQIGLIVGPSASGKTTIARRLFGERLVAPAAWPEDRAVIDGLGERPIRELTGLLTAVGLGSPVAWVKPYHVLSAGERFRCDLARALAGGPPDGEPPPIVAIDEYTSVVDRTVARFASAALARAIRGGRLRRRFVAVTCHADIARWLAPDWTLDTGRRACRWGRPRPPRIDLEVVRGRAADWARFAPHHYLSGGLNPAARCFLARLNRPADIAAFCATLPLVGRRGRWRITRLVTRPEFQGVGIGMRLAETVAELHRAQGLRIGITASHPAVVGHCGRSPRWRLSNVNRAGSRPAGPAVRDYRGTPIRPTASFEYLG
jgi:GNAT superfamily N-acetyltransferase